MPFTMSYPDPTGVDPIPSGTTYIYCSLLQLDFRYKVGRITFDVHRNKAAADAGKQPVDQVTFNINPDEQVIDLPGGGSYTVPAFDALIAGDAAAYTAIYTDIYTACAGWGVFKDAVSQYPT